MLVFIIKSRCNNSETCKDYLGYDSCLDLPSVNSDCVHSHTFTNTHFSVCVPHVPEIYIQ